MKANFRQVFFKHRNEWRQWLSEHHASEKGIWLIFYKKHSGKRVFFYEEAVEEALCYGWIDSTVKRVDNETYIQQFTPRNKKSNWSELNTKRYYKLLAEGKITDAGRKKFSIMDSAGMEIKKCPEELLPASAYFLEFIQCSPDLYKAFAALPPWQQKHFTKWVDSAKKPDTRMRRALKAAELLKKGEHIGMK